MLHFLSGLAGVFRSCSVHVLRVFNPMYLCPLEKERESARAIDRERGRERKRERERELKR